MPELAGQLIGGERERDLEILVEGHAVRLELGADGGRLAGSHRRRQRRRERCDREGARMRG
jgi:hypothetical protein